MGLRDYQQEALNQLRLSLARGNKRPMLQAPTAFGKTKLAGAVVSGALAKNKRVIFCVPAIDLIDQTVESFRRDGITQIGVLQGSHELTDTRQPVQVASIQTLMRRKIPHADLVVVDEAHRWFDFMARWMGEWNNIPFIGLSATPWTKGLGKHYDDLIQVTTTAELIERGYLSPFRVYGPSKPDLSKCRTVAGDYNEQDLSAIMDEPKLVADVVETWCKNWGADKTLCFAVDRAHAKHLAERFESVGISTGYVDAFTTREERAEIREKFHTGEIRVVCNVGCLTTGVDWDVRCIVLARPTKSEMLYVQIIGRGLRTADGKDSCMILDHTSTTENLGFVTEINHPALDDGKKSKSKSQAVKPEKLPKSCPSCTYLKPAGVHACPACGFAPQKPTALEEAEGKLIEFTKAGKKRKCDKQAFFSALIGYARSKDFSIGWCAHTYRDYFGVWPNSLSRDPGPMTQECQSYITYKKIKYAHRRQA